DAAVGAHQDAGGRVVGVLADPTLQLRAAHAGAFLVVAVRAVLPVAVLVAEAVVRPPDPGGDVLGLLHQQRQLVGAGGGALLVAVERPGLGGGAAQLHQGDAPAGAGAPQ